LDKFVKIASALGVLPPDPFGFRREKEQTAPLFLFKLCTFCWWKRKNIICPRCWVP